MDNDLIATLRSVAETIGEIAELPSEDAGRVASGVGCMFVANTKNSWWWDALREPPARVIDYDDFAEMQAAILALLPDQQATLYLVVTDIEPWPVFAGPLDRLLLLVGESSFFEYFVTDANNTWAIFDTHHNQLIVAGEMKQR